MNKIKPVLTAVVFGALHAWALLMLFRYGPVNRQVILVCVYSTFLVVSAVLTKRFPPPLLPSLVLFGVVFGWWLMYVKAAASIN
jgi:hypothetical protein